MKTKIQPLSASFVPKLIAISLNCDQELIGKVTKELQGKCKQDPDQCFGYFPGMKQKAIRQNLPACKEFAKQLRELKVAGHTVKFNFLRMSLIFQPGLSPFHLDTDAATALTGNADTLSQRLVWRLLINLHENIDREMAYLDADPESVKLSSHDGYVHCEDKQIENESGRLVAIPPRQGREVHAVLFCASRVLHSGVDGELGHFVAGYGCEETL